MASKLESRCCDGGVESNSHVCTRSARGEGSLQTARQSGGLAVGADRFWVIYCPSSVKTAPESPCAGRIAQMPTGPVCAVAPMRRACASSPPLSRPSLSRRTAPCSRRSSAHVGHARYPFCRLADIPRCGHPSYNSCVALASLASAWAIRPARRE